jgi:large subunit ribosomal protein L21
MYAVIKTGGKQHKVTTGDLIQIELLEGNPGDKVTFEPLLVVEDNGTTHFGKDASKAVVTGTLAGEKKGEKVQVFKYKPKTGYKRKTGHRQTLTMVEIEDVKLGATAKKPAATAASKKAAPAEPAAAAPANKASEKKKEAAE